MPVPIFFNCMMFSSEQYRQMADEASRLSEAATTKENRVIWLKIAEGYRLLADQAEDTAEGPGIVHGDGENPD